MKNCLRKIAAAAVSVIPAMAAIAMTISANNIASPFIGQPVPPESLKKYRKF
ncbi:MAG: cyclic lactone autoinducer peptide [bacterium]|nr:cyclic lactone autoinducer peptide [bacterium]